MAIEAFASAAVVERARTGSERFEVESLELRIAEMEEAKAVGSLRLDFCFESLVLFGFSGGDVDALESESESLSEVDGEVGMSEIPVGRCKGFVIAVSTVADASELESELARLTVGNSSSFLEVDVEGLE